MKIFESFSIGTFPFGIEIASKMHTVIEACIRDTKSNKAVYWRAAIESDGSIQTAQSGSTVLADETAKQEYWYNGDWYNEDLDDGDGFSHLEEFYFEMFSGEMYDEQSSRIWVLLIFLILVYKYQGNEAYEAEITKYEGYPVGSISSYQYRTDEEDIIKTIDPEIIFDEKAEHLAFVDAQKKLLGQPTKVRDGVYIYDFIDDINSRTKYEYTCPITIKNNRVTKIGFMRCDRTTQAYNCHPIRIPVSAIEGYDFLINYLRK